MSIVSTLTLVGPSAREVPIGLKKSQPRLSSVVYAESVMAEVAAFEFAGGIAAVFSTRSPYKSTPNEDAAGLLPIGPTSGVLAVADGLGGHAGGERASRLAIETIEEALAGCSEADSAHIRAAILNGIEAANEVVQAMGTGAATTLAIVEIQDRVIRTYHVGDSAILLTGQRGKLKLQTIAHSPIGYAVEAGLIDEADAIHHEQRHMISNVIGSNEMRIEIGPTVRMAARDTLVLTSDGLLDNLLPNEIVEAVRTGPLDQAVGQLVSIALGRMNGAADASDTTPSKPDDLTIIAFRPQS